MKELFLSMVLTISSFLGINKNKTEIQLTPIVTNIPTQIEIPTIEPTKISTPSIIVKKTTPIPTKIIKPKTSLTKEILKNIFGFNEDAQIDQVLNDPNQVNKYEQEYYQKFKKHPMFKIEITDGKKQYIMPTKNGAVVCTGDQLKSVYEENTKVEEVIKYQEMDKKCHYGKEQETDECREWRRVNDPSKKDRKQKTIEELEIEIRKAIRSNEDYDGWIEKYCK